jgi:hypothetical protein
MTREQKIAAETKRLAKLQEKLAALMAAESQTDAE